MTYEESLKIKKLFDTDMDIYFDGYDGRCQKIIKIINLRDAALGELAPKKDYWFDTLSYEHSLESCNINRFKFCLTWEQLILNPSFKLLK